MAAQWFLGGVGTFVFSLHRVVLIHGRFRDDMKFTLGVEPVRAISDGGMDVQYNVGEGPVNFQPNGIKPVLAVEVKVFLYFLIVG